MYFSETCLCDGGEMKTESTNLHMSADEKLEKKFLISERITFHDLSASRFKLEWEEKVWMRFYAEASSHFRLDTMCFSMQW